MATTISSSVPSLATSTMVLRVRKVVDYCPPGDVADLAEERPKKNAATSKKTTASSKRKCDDSEDDSDEDDDDSDDDDDAPPPKKRNRCRKSDNAIKKRIKAELLPIMRPFKDALLTRGGFVEEHWKQLYDQLGDDDEYVRELFFSDQKQSKEWRRTLLGHARDLVDPGRNGSVSHSVANSALVRGLTAPFTATIRFVDGDDANVVATGNFVWTLEQFRDGNDDFVPPPDVADCFAKGDSGLAMKYALLECNSILEVATESYEYVNAKTLAAQVKEKYGLSSSFATFSEEFYKEIVSFTSAEAIIAMCDLPQGDLDAKIEEFMEENTDLEPGSKEYEMAFLMRHISILRIGSIIRGMAQLLDDGLAGLVRLADGSYAILTMGRPEMVVKGRMSRTICPGAAIRNNGNRHDNKHSIVFDPYLLVSPTRSMAFNTKAPGQNSKLDDPIYGARTMKIGDESRLFRRLHENLACNKPCEKYDHRAEMIRYELQLPEHGTIQQHQFNLIYAKACGIGTESLEYLYKDLRSKATQSSMADKCVHPEDKCDGDHCFHRLMMISNSIYFCFPVDHTTNQICATHRKNAKDWNYTLTVRKYVGGN
jgi:hypothetical protein